jgi:GcrA cell cycle regulator
MPKMHPEGWTPDRVERLKKLWAEGFSANDIAMTIRNVSRNAVIGKIHRLNLPKRELRKSTKPGSIIKRRNRPPLRTVFDATPNNVHHTNPKVKQMRAIAEQTRAVPVIKTAPLPAPVPGLAPLNLSLLELGPTSCKWAVNEPPKGEQFLFCGHQRKDGSPYCEFHHSRAYQKPSAYTPKRPKYAVAA